MCAYHCVSASAATRVSNTAPVHFAALLGLVGRVSGFAHLPRAGGNEGKFFTAAFAPPRDLSTFNSKHGNIKEGSLRSRYTTVLFVVPPRVRELSSRRKGRHTAARCVTRRGLATSTVVSMAAAAAAAADGEAGKGIAFRTTDFARRRNNDAGSVAFVTGANRGIGIEVTRQLLERTKGAFRCAVVLSVLLLLIRLYAVGYIVRPYFQKLPTKADFNNSHASVTTCYA